MSGRITLENLMIVDVPHASRIKDFSWKQGLFFPAEECDRQLLIGHKDDLEKIPEEIRRQAVVPKDAKSDSALIIETGPEAYRHLLNVAVGMLDKQLGEKETIEGMRSNWLRYTSKEEGQSRKLKFGNIIEAIFTDSKAVRAKVFEDRVGGNYLRPVSSEPAVAARNMLDIKPVDKVLVIGEKETITLNTIKVLDTAFRKQRQDEMDTSGIVVTHPDPAEYARLVPVVNAMKLEKKLKGSVECKPYDLAMGSHFPQADFVFNCQPMDNGPHDAVLMEKTRQRTNPNSVIMHLKGVPLNRNTTSQAWQTNTPDRVFFVEDLKRQDQLDRVHNQRMRGLAEQAIENCLASRRLGRRPVEDRLLMPIEDYKAFVSNKGAPQFPSRGRKGGDHASQVEQPPGISLLKPPHTTWENAFRPPGGTDDTPPR